MPSPFRQISPQGQSVERRIANYETRFAAIGQEPPEPKKETNLLLKALDILDRPRNVLANLAMGAVAGEGTAAQKVKSGITGREKTSAADILQQLGLENKVARGVLGFAGDVLLDPLAYLSLGASGAGKTALKLAGKRIADVTPVVKTAKKAVQATKLPELFGPAFSTKYIRRGVTSAGEMPDIAKARDIITNTPREIRGGQQVALGELAKRWEGITPEAATEAAKIIEKGTSRRATGKGLLAANIGREMSEETAAKDIAAGIEFEKIPNYIRHLYKDPPEKVQRVLSNWQKERARLSPKGGFQKQRTIPTIEQAKKLGLNPVEDVRILTAVREMEGIRLRTIENMYGALKEMGENVATSASKAPAGWKVLPAKQLKDLAVHPEIARFLERFNETMASEEGTRTFLHILNSVQNAWKGLVTAPSPAFHIRNAIGNVFNNFLGGVVNPKFYQVATSIQRGSNEVYQLAGKPWTSEDILRTFREKGLEGFGFFRGESPKALKEMAEEVFTKKTLLQSLGPITAGRKIGDVIETNAKLAHFIDKLAKGATPDDAAESVRKYLFDYTDLTEIERKIKNFVPFYTWTRKNIPVQLESLITQPGKLTALNKAVTNARQATGTSEGDIPGWMQSEMAVPVRVKPDGTTQYLMLDLPLSSLNMFGGGETTKNILGMLSPFAKVPIEIAQNQQIFSGAPIEKYPGAKARYGNLELPAKAAYGLSQLGSVPRTAADIAGRLGPVSPPTGTIAPPPTQLPIAGTFLKNVSPKRERDLKALERERQLANYRRFLEETQGIQVPTISEISAGKTPFRRVQ